MSTRSLNFHSASRWISRVQAAPTSTKGTIAVWIHRHTTGVQDTVASFGDNAGPNTSFVFNINASNQIQINVFVGGALAGQYISTNTVDNAPGFHHICVAVDTTQATANNRAHVYLDGIEVSYGTRTNPAQNAGVFVGGTWYYGTLDYSPSASTLNALLDDVYFIDGQQLTPASFISAGGSIAFAGSYGAQGHYLDFEDNTSLATLGLDRSGLAHNFTLNGNYLLSDSQTAVPPTGVVATNLAVGSPVFGTPLLATLVALPLTTGSPVLGVADFAVLRTLAATNLVVGSPEFGTPSVAPFQLASLGPDWTIVNAKITGPFPDQLGDAIAIGLFDKPQAGPFEISQAIVSGDVEELWRWEIDAKQASNKLIEIGLRDDAGNAAWCVFDPAIGGQVYRTGLGSFRLIEVESDALAADFYKLKILVSTSTNTNLRAYARLNDINLNPNYTGDGLGGVILANPRLMAGDDRREFRWEIGEPEMRFYWTVHIHDLGLIWFRAGQGQAGVDPHLRIIRAVDLECVLRRWKPAHTDIVFDYSGLSGGTGDPMAGTP